MADQLAAVSDLETLLERDGLSVAKVELLIECATAVVQSAAGGQRIVQVIDDTVTLPGGTGSYLRLPQRPVTAVSAVVFNGSTLTAGTGYRLSAGRLWRCDGWATCSWEPSEVAVTYSHGYPPDAQELQLARSAVIGLIRDVYDNPTGLKAESIDDYSATFSALSTQMDGTPALRGALRKQYGRRGGFVTPGSA